MKISPRYDTDPIIRLDGPPAAVREPFLRQRRRFAELVSSLSPEQLATTSRCEGWRVQDVVAHLASTDQFWNLAISSGVAGAPTRMLGSFDPKATPAALVDAVRDAPPADTVASFLDAVDGLCATVEALDDEGWTALAEAPVGHIAVSANVHHALWDCWVHERDILEPLGMAQDEEPDEILAGLRYVAALSPAFALTLPTPRAGALALELDRPTARVVVAVDEHGVTVADAEAPEGALILTGDGVELLEALSLRGPWRWPVPDDQAWLVSGLAQAFESTPGRAAS